MFQAHLCGKDEVQDHHVGSKDALRCFTNDVVVVRRLAWCIIHASAQALRFRRFAYSHMAFDSEIWHSVLRDSALNSEESYDRYGSYDIDIRPLMG